MTYSIDSYIAALTNQPTDLNFTDTMAVIDAHYDFTETKFKNGQQHNDAGQNSGSCKVFSFAILNGLTQEQTLNMFAQYYRDVLAAPEASDHANIRQFMLNGFEGLQFEVDALSLKA